MGLTLPQYSSGCGWTTGSPYTSLVEACKTLAWMRFANPSILMAPITEVFTVLMGLYW